jgi:hypothetical protein
MAFRWLTGPRPGRTPDFAREIRDRNRPLPETAKITIIIASARGAAQKARLRSHPSNLSGSYQRREPR